MSRGGAEKEHIVGRFQRGARREGAFHLSRPPLVFDRAQIKAQRREAVTQCVEDRLHQVHVGLGVVVITGLNRPGLYRPAADTGGADIVFAQVIVGGDAQQIPLDLRTHDAEEAAPGEPLQRLAQKLPWGEMKWPAVVEVFVTENPADARRPRKRAKCRRVADEGEIG